MKTYTAIYAIPELLIMFIGVAFIGWLIWESVGGLKEGCLGSGVARSAQ